ncbi:MAG: hypothetical protein H8E79_05475 [Desulfobulbaceae bacterium]|uniref:Uncharacterized protein n=1 Tax=Candidatus Desulfatifera sulfidica TaxID=2841691 RepID=A0A8J6TAD3_9BACT|nr:hypothetical protein [Candidatus Desulfatifera sulfidica]
MMWNGSGWGPMHGGWFMPWFGLIFLVVCLYFVWRGSSCHSSSERDAGLRDDLRHLQEEMRELRRDLAELKKQDATKK